MIKIINIILITLCTNIYADTKIEIMGGRPRATLDKRDSQILYEQLNLRAIPIALGNFKEFRLKGELPSNQKNSNDLNIECSEINQTKTYECIIDITKNNSNRTILIEKNGYFNLVLNSPQDFEVFNIVLNNIYKSSDNKVIIDCIDKPKCYVALAFPPPAKKPKNNSRNNFCTLF